MIATARCQDVRRLSAKDDRLEAYGTGFWSLVAAEPYCTVIDPRLAGRPVGVPPELTVMVCTAWVDVPVPVVVILPHPSSVAAMKYARASQTRWRRRSLPVMINPANNTRVSAIPGARDRPNGIDGIIAAYVGLPRDTLAAGVGVATGELEATADSVKVAVCPVGSAGSAETSKVSELPGGSGELSAEIEVVPI